MAAECFIRSAAHVGSATSVAVGLGPCPANQVMIPALLPEGRDSIRNLTAFLPCRSCADTPPSASPVVVWRRTIRKAPCNPVSSRTRTAQLAGSHRSSAQTRGSCGVLPYERAQACRVEERHAVRIESDPSGPVVRRR
jgi:hypothetical protein